MHRRARYSIRYLIEAGKWKTMENRLLIIHDVLGTLFSLDEPINTLRSARPDLSEKEAYLIIFDWYHAGEQYV